MDKLTATKYFIKVADTGSFSKTARLLDVPVSTISRRVKDLEQHLGVELLKRTTRYLSLTDVGKAYYNQINQAVNDFDMADQIVQETSTNLSGRIKISALPSFANKHLYPILEKFRSQYPDITIELITTDTVQDIMKDGIDFVIRPTNTPPQDLVAKVIDMHRMAIVASPEYLKNSAPIKNWRDIKHHKSICYAGSNGIMPWYIFSENNWHEIEKTPYVIFSDTCKILDIVINGEGIALLPEWTYLESQDNGLLKPINKNWQTYFTSNNDQRLYLLYDKKTSQLKRNQTFLKFFLEQIK